MRALILATALLSVSAGAQTVYKCTDANGAPIFSQRPCSADPSKVQTVDTSRSLRTGTGGGVAEVIEFANMNEVKRRCAERLDVIAARYAGRRIAIAEEISALEYRISRTRNNLAGATVESGVRQQIAGLAAERGALASAEAQEMEGARDQCRASTDAEQARIDAARAARRAAADDAARAAEQQAAQKVDTPSD